MELKFKKIKAITKIAKDTKVVNFSVKKNENYFANGILTHNCYMKRHKPEGLSVATNTMDILTEINSHAYFATVEKPNQTGEYITYDISCNEDFALHAKYHEWERIFEFFRDHPLAMGSFATKHTNNALLNFNPEGKIRIRFSLIPEKWRALLEPNTSTISTRLNAVNLFLKAGYEVHLNFSPVIVHDNWLLEYETLFASIDYYANVYGWNNTSVKAEVIFLTHNEEKHKYNLAQRLTGEYLLWAPKIQEGKVSQYGGKNLRYEHNRKADYIKQFVKLHDEIIPWNTIRYCFTLLLLFSYV
jgi:spore photoproduct lyase